MIKIFSLLLAGIVNISTAIAGQPQTGDYQYFLDLNKVSDDQLTVELITPKLNTKTARFNMPKIVPGTYTIYDFGRFVNTLRAFDKDGNRLQVNHDNVNSWLIQDAEKLYRITYQVDDTYDANPEHNPVAGMSGTNFRAGEVFVMNTYTLFGYFEDQDQIPVHLDIKKPKGFFGSTAHKPNFVKETSESYTFENYFGLTDSPMLFCEPDTSTVMVGETEVLVSVYSATGNNKSEYIADNFSEMLKATGRYLGKLPVEKYAFLMYFVNQDEGRNGNGALEHNYSSLYALPDYPQEQIIPFLRDIAAHEFFHILTPLNIHSEEIHYFDFNDPDMSRHLWLYEGVTEYFSHHMQLAEGLIDLDEFLNEMSDKLNTSLGNYEDNLPFTKMSSHVLEDYQSQFGNVYEKGALIGLCLDITLRRNSDGKYGIKNLMLDLSKKFGSEEPFKDRKLFKEIAALSDKETMKFFKKYVSGKKSIPYEEYFSEVGITYTAPSTEMGYSLGNINLGFNPETQHLFVANNSNMNGFGKALGYRTGDEILEINGKQVPSSGIQEFISDTKANMQEGNTMKVKVLREVNGEKSEVELIAPIQKVEIPSPAKLEPNAEMTSKQKELYAQWSQGEKSNKS